MRQTPLLKSPNILPICFLSLVGTQILLILFGAKIVVDQNEIKARMDRTLVQMRDGTTFVAEKHPSSQRSPEAIKVFVRDWLKAQYSFSGKALDGEGKVIRDRGVKIGETRIPLTAYSASFAIPTKLRNEFLKVLAREWLPKNYFENSPTVVEFNIYEMSEPRIKDEKENTWEVIVIAELIYQSASNSLSTKDFARSVVVKPINISPGKLSKIAPFSEKMSYQWRSRGLMVVGLEEYE